MPTPVKSKQQMQGNRPSKASWWFDFSISHLIDDKSESSAEKRNLDICMGGVHLTRPSIHLIPKTVSSTDSKSLSLHLKCYSLLSLDPDDIQETKVRSILFIWKWRKLIDKINIDCFISSIENWWPYAQYINIVYIHIYSYMYIGRKRNGSFLSK